MLDRHRATIGVQKPDFARRKLRVIVTAALDLSNRKGFQAMSLRDLSRDSGVSMGGLYAYFDSKTTLLNMILTEVTAAVQRSLSDPPAAISADPRAHLLWLIDTHIRLTEAMLPWFTFAFMEAKNFPASERRMATDTFRPDTSPLLPALIKPMLQDWYVKRTKYRRRNVAMQTYIDTVQAIVLASCDRA
jgi:AcrR family transcriptional regulator